MTALEAGGRLCGLWFSDQKRIPVPRDEWRAAPELPFFRSLQEQLDTYFQIGRCRFNLPLLLQGTPFQTAIWRLLQTVPGGDTVTYGDLARMYAKYKGGMLTSARAVGGAVGRNPVAIIVPCHRVIGAGGVLTGYAGGLSRKAVLLELEQRLGREPG